MHKFGTGKSDHKFTYTYTDIAKATGLQVGTLRNYAYYKKFNPADIKSVAVFISKHSVIAL